MQFFVMRPDAALGGEHLVIGAAQDIMLIRAGAAGAWA
jgi:hypothetical protein